MTTDKLTAILENLCLLFLLLFLQQQTCTTSAQSTDQSQATPGQYTDQSQASSGQVTFLRQVIEVIGTQSRQLADTQYQLDSLKGDLQRLTQQLTELTKSCKLSSKCPSENDRSLPPVCDNHHNCQDWRDAGFTSSGTYTIVLKEAPLTTREVYCDMETDEGGWMVFQRRQDGTEDFQRTWQEYKEGFGQVDKEFWMGNEALHEITQAEVHELRVDLQDFSGETRFAVFNSFALGPETDNYRLAIGANTEGDAGNGLMYHRNRNFTTVDRDNDDDPRQHCSLTSTGGWWYGGCSISQLNSHYYSRDQQGGWHNDGIHWNTWHYDDLKFTEMKIRPKIRD